VTIEISTLFRSGIFEKKLYKSLIMTNQDEPKTVLVIDDEKSIRHTLGAFLEDDGFLVLQSESGESALQIITQRDIQICLVDMSLPRMDGNEFILKSSEVNSELRYLILTGDHNYKTPQELKKIGISEENIIFKPILDMTSLTDKIQSVLLG